MEAKLVIFKRDGKRKDIPISGEITVIGRGEECGLRVPLLAVSREHCELSMAGEKLAVKDLGSSNGTYVNSSRVTETDLEAGDRLAVGPVIFTVQIDGKPEQIAPIKSPGEPGGEEEILDLQADRSEESDVLLALGSTDDDDELDPISALEALAAEGEGPDKDENGRKKNPA